MKQTSLRAFFGVFLTLFLLINLSGVLEVSAENSTTNSMKSYTFPTTGDKNALPGANEAEDLTKFGGKVISTMLKLVASVGIAILIYNGIRMILSQGNDSKLKNAQGGFMKAIIGVIIVLFAYVMISFIEGLLTDPLVGGI